MDKRDHVKELMDVILQEVIQETGNSEKGLPDITKAVLGILSNLNGQIAEQKEYINKLGEKIEKNEHDFKLLIEELRKEGHLRIRERRNLLRRSMLFSEAIINLLDRNGVIDKNELQDEIKKLNREHGKVEQSQL